MSELIVNHADRLERLVSFARGMVRLEDGKSLVTTYQSDVETITPAETMQVLDQLLVEGFSVETIKKSLGKILNVFYKPLSNHNWEKPGEGHFLTCLMAENRQVEKIMTRLKSILKTNVPSGEPDEKAMMEELLIQIKKLKEYELHYIKKENILFPYIEKTFPQYRCLQLMWSFHDDFRRFLKRIELLLELEQPDRVRLNRELGKLFFVVLPIIFREEQILFPVARKAVTDAAWDEMLQQSHEIGWCYIEPPKVSPPRETSVPPLSGKVRLGTGSLTADQLMLLLNNLPVDITFVDENDEVCYFSGTKDRIFPRSNAIIGRKVQNCHPQESVHVVNDIVDAFRAGEQDHADFWIQMKGRFILIRYFALRDETGSYKGTIEVSQDATEIRHLQGERRLLAWKKE